MKKLTKKHRIAHESSKLGTNAVTSTADRLQNERLSDYLIRKGVLSPEMLSQIRSELDDSKSIPKTPNKPDNKKKQIKTHRNPRKK